MSDIEEVDSRPRWDPSSFYAKEMKRWNTAKRDGGHRCDGFQEYPRMLYKAQRRGGPFVVIDPLDERFSAANTLVVGNQHEYERARSNGWRETPDAARDYAEGLENDIAVAAAHRHHEDQHMSEKAQAEAAAADTESAEHLPEIPAKPLARKGRKIKA